MGGGWILSVKIGLASAAAFSSAVALRQAAPLVAAFVAAEGPRLYKSIAAWLAPPYLYFIINGIILSIAATSRFPKSLAAAAADDSPPNASPPPPSISPEADLPAPTECVSKDADLLPELLAPAIGAEEGFVISRSSWSPRRRGSSENLTEKPPVSARLGRRKSIKASPEGKALRVTRPRKHETLESTWRTITDGRPVPLARHLKKADTWDTHVRAAATTGPTPPPPAMRKSETFAAPPSAAADHPSPAASSGGSSSPAGKIRREASFGQDDLNRRVEAFIKKFNEEMRLQRQESLQQYMDMINRSGN